MSKKFDTFSNVIIAFGIICAFGGFLFAPLWIVSAIIFIAAFLDK